MEPPRYERASGNDMNGINVCQNTCLYVIEICQHKISLVKANVIGDVPRTKLSLLPGTIENIELESKCPPISIPNKQYI